jgi:hypothetical protein
VAIEIRRVPTPVWVAAGGVLAVLMICGGAVWYLYRPTESMRVMDRVRVEGFRRVDEFVDYTGTESHYAEGIFLGSPVPDSEILKVASGPNLKMRPDGPGAVAISDWLESSAPLVVGSVSADCKFAVSKLKAGLAPPGEWKLSSLDADLIRSGRLEVIDVFVSCST